MYGELNIKPWELYRMTIRDALLAIAGLREKDLYNQSILRKATTLIMSSFIGVKAVGIIKKGWPIDGSEDNKEELIKTAIERMKKANEFDDTKKVKHILSGRSKTGSNR